MDHRLRTHDLVVIVVAMVDVVEGDTAVGEEAAGAGIPGEVEAEAEVAVVDGDEDEAEAVGEMDTAKELHIHLCIEHATPGEYYYQNWRDD